MSNNHIESEIIGLILECKVPVVSKMNYTATKGTQLVLEFWSLMKFGNLKTNCIVLEYTCGLYGIVPIIENKQQNPALYKLENFEGENSICCTNDEYRKAP